MEAQVNYVGRFAPSPTGALHFGSVVAALASYLDARHHHGKWLLRIEDLDPPREQPEAPGLIIEQLKHMGFRWDGEVSYQSQHLSKYDDYLNQLQRAGKLFPLLPAVERASTRCIPALAAIGIVLMEIRSLSDYKSSTLKFHSTILSSVRRPLISKMTLGILF